MQHSLLLTGSWMILLKLMTLGLGKSDCFEYTVGASEKSAKEGPSNLHKVEK